MPRKEVFFNADDFGRSAEINAAIARAHDEGVLHGAGLMVGQPGTAEAVRLAREHPRLAVGWHLHLCDATPLTRPRWPWGESAAAAGWAIGMSREAREFMRRELAAQWDEYRGTGLPCAFVNAHHHLHAHPMVYSALLSVLPTGASLWLRLGAPRRFSRSGARWAAASEWFLWRRRRGRCPFRSSDTLWGIDRLFRMQAREVAAAARDLPPGLHEFMFHPRRTAGDAEVECLIALKGMGFR